MRRYNVWAGNPEGMEENPEGCIVEVWSTGRFSYQCSRTRRYGPDGCFCKQHAKMIEAGTFNVEINVPKDKDWKKGGTGK